MDTLCYGVNVCVTGIEQHLYCVFSSVLMNCTDFLDQIQSQESSWLWSHRWWSHGETLVFFTEIWKNDQGNEAKPPGGCSIWCSFVLYQKKISKFRLAEWTFHSCNVSSSLIKKLLFRKDFFAWFPWTSFLQKYMPLCCMRYKQILPPLVFSFSFWNPWMARKCWNSHLKNSCLRTISFN